jgi:hypothetical protein
MRARTVYESLKFERGLNPKDAMKIGLWSPRTFNDENEFYDYVIYILPYIFDGKIPDDILSKDEDGILPQSYFEIINNKLLDIDYEIDGRIIHPANGTSWPANIRARLEKMGYERAGGYENIIDS